ncbi:dTDP-4-dehydrorhamnose 3,5-epimerase [Gordonibacter sp. 28C]|uniref:dTDP-4-dehydrorhamnose 3,5-epimerase n=1 Tax=Gordonibacter sp. 28C TaxID=2078569 RepID=UPI000DF75D0A|nr:dTDP-4-dehydrorhamnose 3,5-epimerase [Gordonibacter sp. 28C]RDB58967.1 dTDP-4-dehydrorhamnose 3,5-epimerase [Gordonibacter sp. 28C]
MAAGDSVKHGNFTFTETSIEGVLVVDAAAYDDERGYFMETYKRPDFVAGGIDAEFVQDNQSSSAKGVLRGLHFQIEHPQSKLVRAVSGEVFDVAVDLRPGSPTYGKWEGVVLTAENRRQFFVPRGFAHGFLVLSDTAEFCYKCDDVYHPGDEGGLAWDDPEIGIDWPIPEGMELVLSEKDRAHPSLWR